MDKKVDLLEILCRFATKNRHFTISNRKTGFKRCKSEYSNNVYTKFGQSELFLEIQGESSPFMSIRRQKKT